MEPLKKPFIVANVRDILDQYDREEISFSRMVEMLNEKAKEFYEPKITKDCSTCIHVELDLDEEPCKTCQVSNSFSNWQPQ